MSYGCYNAPRPVAGQVTHQGQNGWISDDLPRHDGRTGIWYISRVPIMIDVVQAMSTDCQYSILTEDKACIGCAHKHVP